MLVDDDPNLYLKPGITEFKFKKHSVIDVPVVEVLTCQCPSCKLAYGIK